MYYVFSIELPNSRSQLNELYVQGLTIVITCKYSSKMGVRRESYHPVMWFLYIQLFVLVSFKKNIVIHIVNNLHIYTIKQTLAFSFLSLFGPVVDKGSPVL